MGIESAIDDFGCADSVALLAAWECDEAQGYYFAKPLSVADMDAWLAAA